MSAEIHVLGVGGSLREVSRTEHAIDVALEASRNAGASVDLFSLRDNPMPMYDDRSDIESYPDSVHKLIESCRKADAIIFGSPVYHGVLTGAMKNALDFIELMARDPNPWLSGKALGLISVAGGTAGINSNNSMLYACQTLKGFVIPTMAAVPGSAFEGGFELKDQAMIDRLRLIGTEVFEMARLLTARAVDAKN